MKRERRRKEEEEGLEEINEVARHEDLHEIREVRVGCLKYGRTLLRIFHFSSCNTYRVLARSFGCRVYL